MDLKLGFKDVMFRPKRSPLKSRSEVSLEQNFKVLHSNTGNDFLLGGILALCISVFYA